MKATVPQDQQVLSLWQEVDIAFGPLSDAVDAASNVLEAFGEVTGDPNAQAAIIGPKLREVWKEVYERVLALVRGHGVQTAAESPGDFVEHFRELFRALVELARASMEMAGAVGSAKGQPMKVEVAWCVLTLEDELEKALQRVCDWEEAMEVRRAS